jgi:hypothetical protein
MVSGSTPVSNVRISSVQTPAALITTLVETSKLSPSHRTDTPFARPDASRVIAATAQRFTTTAP